MREDLAVFLKRTKFQNIREIIIPGLLTFCVLIFLFWMKGLAPFGTKSLVVMDADIQYLDFFCYFKDVLEGKNSIGYSFGKRWEEQILLFLAIIYPLRLICC